ncbi:helix-turn-helix domain-containing protein [Oceanobacillus profundus]|uniref:Crp/Fnr family transcriptional regulator n=1 Tax=Oceanobacillus TaxID=182709 RepID=UPI0026E48AFA|nr:helix-turn-helix domain-containing protein [Oceanobacillus profundus]MDO6450789.1 helix-turn-helix domain-containing protein [Oceanobacillus profundus]
MRNIQDSELLEKYLDEFQINRMFHQSKQLPYHMHQYHSGEIIRFEGIEMNSLLFLVNGKARITSSIETGKALLLRFIYPLSVIGDIELIRDVPVQSQVQAVDECLVIGVPFDHIKKYEIDNPRLLHMLLEHVCFKLQTCTTASRVNLLASVENKFASYLMSTLSPDADNEFGIELQTSSVKEIASLLGTTYRHLNRVISSLIEQGIIERQKNSIQILNWKELEKAANGIRYK